MKILVTGAGGYVGTHLCGALTEAGHDVIGVGLERHMTRIESAGCKGLYCDLASNGELVLPPVDAVVYLAQSSHYRQMPDMAPDLFAVNTLGVVRLAEAARRSGAKTFLYASTGNVYTPSFLPLREDSPLRDDDFYGLSKQMGEKALVLFAPYLNVISMRIFGVYGPGQENMLIPRLIERVRCSEPITLEPGEGEADTGGLRLTPCYVDDLTAIIGALLSREIQVQGPINLAGPEVISIGRIAKEAGCLLGVEPLLRIAQGKRKGDLVADTTLLRSLVDVPFTPFVEGMRRTLFGE
ncbi:NAD-dependent epimerase/dehydratase family protein [Heliobacterium undosum]|uniref:NAD-dependent epimerase/dehydratase family protein n=1 Tax=Heliomicrobium undosum TaxID=121734 RepID=A0A845L3T1_9FIRM|nr:NAD(P)-dependent oxidoreductase [Heliomicrobium undosum]MZP29504.1 NAD-dependent epimerase/dehydratase family protein [Heliomicrobium undosum]